MTKYNELQVSARPSRKRIGRGISAGQGKTAGRGTKGQKARTGKKIRPTFTGGQLALVKAIPKFHGFKSLHASAQVVYSDQLNVFDGKTVDNMVLYRAELIASPYQAVKAILRDEITAKVDLKIAGASSSVRQAITKAGGTFVKTAVPLMVSTKENRK